MRLSRDIPKIPLEDENDDLLTDEQCAALAAMPDVQARALAQSRAVRVLQMSIRAENAIKASTNEGRTQLLKQKMARNEAMILERPKLAAWVVSDLVMPAVIHELMGLSHPTSLLILLVASSEESKNNLK